jgi:NAD(P)-dependent dehydrogenase (short-subunit alcohol dehydrogenase family)
MTQSESEPEVYVITGGAGGMGRACACRFGRYDGEILLADSDASRLDAVARDLHNIGVTVQTTVCDIGDKQSIKSLAGRAGDLGRVKAIVHTAGLSPSMACWQDILIIDLVGTALILDAFLPLAGPETTAVCIASVAAHLIPIKPEIYPILDDPLHPEFMNRITPIVGEDQVRAYGLAKCGVVRLCRRLAPAWGKHHARIVSLSPGTIRTPMSDLELASHAVMQKLVDQTPLGRVGTPEEIAAAVDFLCSKDASFITGCDIIVDGGKTAALLHNPEHLGGYSQR